MRIRKRLTSRDEVEQWLELLRNKWGEVPAGSQDRSKTTNLLALSDQELFQMHNDAVNESTTGDGFTIRGWYHHLYKDSLRGKSVLDVGSGFGIDGITFALGGASVTFLDIVKSNLIVLERLCGTYGLTDVEFLHLEALNSLEALPNDYDVIWCQGSLITAPFHVVKLECQLLLEHLRPSGRWIELAYPKARWEREGKLAFEVWGGRTDGGAPWIEWYDLPKLLARLDPARFDVVLYLEFHNSDFNWFDLVRKR